MKKPIYFVLVVLAIAGVFLTGSLYGQRWAMRPPNLASDEKISPMDSTHSAHTVNALMIAPASTMSPKQASTQGGGDDGSVAYLEGRVVRSGGFSVVGVADCGGFRASDVDSYQKVTELEANKDHKVTTV